MKLATPIAYQMVRGQRVIVPCRYRVSGNRIRFELGSYDRSRVLLIDPTLLFVRLIEGYTPQALTTDQRGNWYTAALSSPTAGAYQEGSNPSLSISKRDANGNVLWTASFNSAAVVTPVSLATDQAGNVYVAGTAYSSFPVTPGAFAPPSGAPSRTAGFVSKLSPDGSQLLYSALLWIPLADGTGVAGGVSSLAVSPDGQMIFTASFSSFQPPSQPPILLGQMLVRLSADGQSVLFARPLKGTVTTMALDPHAASSGGWHLHPSRSCAGFSSTDSADDSYASLDGGVTIQTFAGATKDRLASPSIQEIRKISCGKPLHSGVFQSRDGGATWQIVDAIGTGSFTSVWIYPRRPELWFAYSYPTLFAARMQEHLGIC